MNPAPGKRELMVVGNDEKVGISDAGTYVFGPAGKDTVSIIDIGTDPLAPRILVNLPLTNSIFGPPVNLAITPDETLALVANSMDAEKDGAGWKMVPANQLFVIDLTTNPSALIDTVTVGKQPSGLSINRAGNLALVTNRADNSIAVLRIAGKKVTLVEGLVFSNDGRYIYVGNYLDRDISILRVDGDQIVNTGKSLALPGQPASMRGRTR